MVSRTQTKTRVSLRAAFVAGVSLLTGFTSPAPKSPEEKEFNAQVRALKVSLRVVHDYAAVPVSYEKLTQGALEGMVKATDSEAAYAANMTKKSFNAHMATLKQKMRALHDNAANPVSYENLVQGALSGMLKSVDPHSVYFNEEKNKKFLDGLNGKFGGVGIRFQNKDGVHAIIEVDKGGPADLAGIQVGDLIVSVDGRSTEAMSIGDVIEGLRGKVDTAVAVDVKRGGEQKSYTIKRAEVEQSTVWEKYLGDGIAYISISSFGQKTAKDFEKAVQKFEADKQNKIESYIVDLRDNAGGYLTASTEVADQLLERGAIVSWSGQKERQEIKAAPGDLTGGKPVAVLVRQQTASASEVLAGALQDHGRGVIIGAKTYGKGVVQTPFVLSDFKGLENRTDTLNLTTAYYYTPEHRSIHGTGIMPDVQVIAPEMKPREGEGSEAALEGSLANPFAAKQQPDDRPRETCALSGVDTKPAIAKEDMLETMEKTPDTALFCAVEYLKGKTVYTKRAPAKAVVFKAP